MRLLPTRASVSSTCSSKTAPSVNKPADTPTTESTMENALADASNGRTSPIPTVVTVVTVW
jgi:hypothetical protein